MASLQTLMVAAFCIVMAVLLMILSCSVTSKRNGWPLMCFVLFCSAPVPFLLCGEPQEDAFFSASSHLSENFQAIGMFMGGALLVSGPLLAFVLYHTGMISGAALAMTWVSGFFILACAASLLLVTGDDESS